ncbi:MAG: hypothetical protein R2834_02760 [Rhodothermales bacterium]
MKGIAKIVSAVGLGLTVVPAFLVFGGSMSIEQHTTLMLIGTVLWFGSAPIWMTEKKG